MSLLHFLLVSGVSCDFCLWFFLDFSVYHFTKCVDIATDFITPFAKCVDTAIVFVILFSKFYDTAINTVTPLALHQISFLSELMLHMKSVMTEHMLYTIMRCILSEPVLLNGVEPHFVSQRIWLPFNKRVRLSYWNRI